MKLLGARCSSEASSVDNVYSREPFLNRMYIMQYGHGAHDLVGLCLSAREVRPNGVKASFC